jgi:hypothetical protein
VYAASGSLANALAGTNDDENFSIEEQSTGVQNENESLDAEMSTEPLDIEMISSVQFEKLLASTELSEAFAIRLWQEAGLLGGTEHGRESYSEHSGNISNLRCLLTEQEWQG